MKSCIDVTRQPGGTEAVQAGCRCPQIDNHYGRGTAANWASMS